MKFFRVHLFDSVDSSAGYEFASNERDARMIVAKFKQNNRDRVKAAGGVFNDKIELIEIEPTKTGILKALNRYAGHPNNG